MVRQSCSHRSPNLFLVDLCWPHYQRHSYFLYPLDIVCPSILHHGRRNCSRVRRYRTRHRYTNSNHQSTPPLQVNICAGLTECVLSGYIATSIIGTVVYANHSPPASCPSKARKSFTSTEMITMAGTLAEAWDNPAVRSDTDEHLQRGCVREY